MKEIRTIDNMKVRQMCIKDELYTCGTCAAYDNLLFNLCDKEAVTLEDIELIAIDIMQHSDVEKKVNTYGCDTTELLANIMVNIINECCYTYIEF